MSEVLHLILRMMLEQWKTMDEELIVYRLKQTAEMAEELERERDEARERYNDLLGLKKEPKWYNGREIPIAVEESAK